MFCTECGDRLTLMFKADEGLVPYCTKCGEYRFPRFATAVSMAATNRAKDKILLAKHKGHSGYRLCAGYVKKGETAEKAVTREFKEETKLDTVKFKYLNSRYLEEKNILMLGFLLIAEDGTPVPDENELESVKWFTFEEAAEAVKNDSLAEAFLKSAFAEIKKF